LLNFEHPHDTSETIFCIMFVHLSKIFPPIGVPL
jgi:hypothetical protein